MDDPAPAGPGAAVVDTPGERRLLWLVGSLTVLLVIGLGFGLYVSKHVSGSTEKKAAKAFLSDVQARQFAAAYGRLCPSGQASVSSTKFASSLQAAAARGRGIGSFDVVSGNSAQLIHGGPKTSPVAQADVKLANGQSVVITLVLGSSGGQTCVLSGESDLF